MRSKDLVAGLWAVVALSGSAWAETVLQVTEMTGDLRVFAPDRQPARLPWIADGSEVEVLSGEASFESPSRARIFAWAGDRFVVRALPGSQGGFELAALGKGTRLRVDIGRAELSVGGGGRMTYALDGGWAAFKVLRPPVSAPYLRLGPGESVRLSLRARRGFGAGDGMTLAAPPKVGYQHPSVKAERLAVHVEEEERGTMLTAWRQAAEPDLRSAPAALPAPLRQGTPPRPEVRAPIPIAEPGAGASGRGAAQEWLLAVLALTLVALMLEWRWRRRDRPETSP